MQSKWRAPACYVGVAVICALYLSVVPGVSITDVCAGAGIGAAVMWAINEWETGKWNVAVPGQAAAATAIAIPAGAVPAGAVPATIMPAAALQATAPAAASSATTATPSEAMAAESTSAESRPRVDSGIATPESLAKWEIDEKEPSWDPSALAETWAKLRRELSISGPRRPQVAPDLPRTAQLAKGPVVAGSKSNVGLGNANTKTGASISSSASSRSTAPVAPAKPAPAKPALGSLSKAYQESQRVSGTSPKPNAVSTPASSAGTKSSYTPGSSFAAPASSTATPARKVAGGSAEPARPNSFLRPGPMRPR